MANFLCPFCYVCPVPTAKYDVDVCYVCRNTLTLQQANSQHEVSLATKKLNSVDSMCSALGKVDFESLAEQLERIETLDLRLQHLLLNEESLKDQQERGKKVETGVSNLESQITLLQGEVQKLSSQPMAEQTCTSAVSNELIAEISSKLDLICAEEPKIAHELLQLKESVDSLEMPVLSLAQPAPTPVFSSAAHAGPQDTVLAASDTPHKPVSLYESNFITTEQEQQLITLFESMDDQFVTEGDRSTVSFGEQYTSYLWKTEMEVISLPEKN